MANPIPKKLTWVASLPTSRTLKLEEPIQNPATENIPLLVERGKKDKQVIELLYTLSKGGKNPQALRALEILAETETAALHALYRIAEEDYTIKKFKDPTLSPVVVGPTSKHLQLLLQDTKFNRVKLKYVFEYAQFSLQSGILLGGGGNRNQQGGFRGSIFPIEAKWVFNSLQPSYKKNFAFFLTVAPEARLGNGPVGWFAGGARVGMGYGWIGANFRAGIHQSGKAYVGGEIDFPGQAFRSPINQYPEGLILYFFPSLILGYERVLGTDQITRRVEESIYAGFQWVVPWLEK